MTTDDAERRLAEALRARAVGMQPMPSAQSYAPLRVRRAAPPEPGMSVRTALLLALLAGVVLGVVLGLMSFWLPGALPPIG
ncbi:hypothetical protein [Pseudonocardia thermophila]|uniref:hypothetical protein n=1 Tax=Pseudonocardia thermophila TaxID=1848 RepID=UPI0011610277|nr:hypothetical protein [Pseudonocardia thermophila]